MALSLQLLCLPVDFIAFNKPIWHWPLPAKHPLARFTGCNSRQPSTSPHCGLPQSNHKTLSYVVAVWAAIVVISSFLLSLTNECNDYNRLQ